MFLVSVPFSQTWYAVLPDPRHLAKEIARRGRAPLERKLSVTCKYPNLILLTIIVGADIQTPCLARSNCLWQPK